MGKTLGKIFKILGTIAGIVAPFLPPPFNFIAAGVAIVYTTIGNKLVNKAKAAEAKLAQEIALLRTTANENNIRLIPYGECATGGVIVHQENHNNSGSWETDQGLSMMIAVAGCEIDSFVKFLWADTAVTFSSNNAVGNFNNQMFMYEFLGTDGQTVQSKMDSVSSNWGTNDRLRGIAGFHLMLKAGNDKFPNGVEQFRSIFKGRKIYDPRLDSTNGGSGTHRKTDPSTWAWSDNPVLCIIDFLRGVRVANSGTTVYDGTIIAGIGLTDDEIDWANIRAEADICDELVDLDAGGSEKRYTLNGFVDPAEDPVQIVEAMLGSMAGRLVPGQGGVWRIYAGAPRTATKARTADHVVGGLIYESKKTITEKFNSVQGLYFDKSDDYEPKNYPPRVFSSYVTQDNGQELPLQLDFPYTNSHTMAQRLAKIEIERSRLEKTVSGAFMPVVFQDQVNDAITFTYTPFNLNAEKFLITEWIMKFANDESGNEGFFINLRLDEEDDGQYDWDETTDELDDEAVTAVPNDDALTNQLTLPPIQVAGVRVGRTTQPLTAVDAGATARIDVAAFSFQFGFGSVSYNSGSISGLSFSTDYFVYFVDPLFEGGAVTYLATTSEATAANTDGNLYVGGITTPANSAPPTSQPPPPSPPPGGPGILD